jgi:hypothetical protein
LVVVVRKSEANWRVNDRIDLAVGTTRRSRNDD